MNNNKKYLERTKQNVGNRARDNDGLWYWREDYYNVIMHGNDV